MHFPPKRPSPFFLNRPLKKNPLLVRYYRMTDRENRSLYYSLVIRLLIFLSMHFQCIVRYYRMTDRENRRLYYSLVIRLKKIHNALLPYSCK